VTVGVVYAETGRTGATFNTVDDVANAWADWVNTERGGVGGHPVEIMAADTTGTARGARAAARSVVEDAGAVGVVIQDPAAEVATVEYLAEHGVPYLGGTASTRPVDGGSTTWPNTHFVIAPSSPAMTAAPVLAAAAVDRQAFGAANCAELPACARAGQLYASVAASLDIDYAGLVVVGASDLSYTAPCLELIGRRADFVNLGVPRDTARHVIDECTVQGYGGSFGAAGNIVSAADLEGVDGLHLAGALNGFPWWADAPAVEVFRTALATYGEGIDARNPSATSTWAALELFRAAMDDSGPGAGAAVTTDDVVAAYRQLAGETLDGLLPVPITFAAAGPQPYVPCFWLFELRDGRFATIEWGESGNGAPGDLRSSCFRG
jgi:branched-chain amino acid transport system substrate-binding protein